MTVTAFAYAKTVVSDSDALTSFYAGALGFTAAIRIEDGEGDNRFVENFLSTGAGAAPQLVLITYANRAAPAWRNRSSREWSMMLTRRWRRLNGPEGGRQSRPSMCLNTICVWLMLQIPKATASN